MRRTHVGYLGATRHPWPCLRFLLPLLAVYEGGVIWLGGAHPETLRNGADTWLRWGLESLGFTQFYCAPALIAAIFVGWSFVRWLDRPVEVPGLWLGMALESVGFAMGLWLLSRQLGPLLDQLGVRLSLSSREETLGRVVTFVGAGIYEEVLFRLLLFATLSGLLSLIGVPGLLSGLITIVASSLVFSLAHHVGPYGEPLQPYVFLFRTLAGCYFALLYQLRGFGIAVGAHAGYDVLVGVLMVGA